MTRNGEIIPNAIPPINPSTKNDKFGFVFFFSDVIISHTPEKQADIIPTKITKMENQVKEIIKVFI